jgi:hypothetical protein
MASKPAHFNDVVLQGEVCDFYRDPLGRILGLVVEVAIDDAPARVPVVLSHKGPRFDRGDLVWLRGTLRAEKFPGARYALVYVAPTHLEVLKARRGACPSSQPAQPA